MKVVKNEELPTQEIDQVKVAELKEKFDLMQSQITTKEYAVLLNKEQTTFLFDEVYNSVAWKGYESYAISETYDTFKKLVDKKGELNGKAKTEYVEAIFHFLKNFEGKGYATAKLFRQVCDQFAIPMTEINQDRQDLRDLSLELVSVEQGIPVEQVLSNLQAQAQG